MNNRINVIEPLCGSYSITRNSYCGNDQEKVECLDILKWINLEKFGNDNLNFIAYLINGHNNKKIVESLQSKIKSEFGSANFAKMSSSKDIMDYIENMLDKFEKKFIIDMGNLHRKKMDLCALCKTPKSESEESNIMVQIDDIENELKSGATISLAALIKRNLYISNIGDNQIILVSKTGNSNDIDDHQFLLQTAEHSFHSGNEINRIKEDCGLNPDALRWLSMLSQERCHSRCIGDFEMKKNYHDIDCLTDASSSPLICKPQTVICQLENNITHILMVSSGLFYLVRELIYDTDKVPGEISRKFFELKLENSQDTLNQLCKKVLECYVTDHKNCHDQYLSLVDKGSQFIEYSQHDDLSIFVIDVSSSLFDSHVTKEDSNGFEVVETRSVNTPLSTDSLESRDLSNTRDPLSSIKSNSNYAIAPITAYVDFTEWDLAMNRMSVEEMSKLDLITRIEDSFGPTIDEESENLFSRSTTVDENKTSDLSDYPSLSPDQNFISSIPKLFTLDSK